MWSPYYKIQKTSYVRIQSLEVYEDNSLFNNNSFMETILSLTIFFHTWKCIV